MATVQEKMNRAKQLIQAKRYDEARKILRTVDHPKAEEWLDKIDGRETPLKGKLPVKIKDRTSGLRIQMYIWMFLTLCSLGWMCYGITTTSGAFNEVVNEPVATIEGLDTEDLEVATAVGATLGAGVGITFFLCSGIPFFLFFAFMAWRNSAGIRTEQRHLEQLAVMRG